MDTGDDTSGLVSFDTEAALQAALDTVDGPLYAFAEYTSSDFEVLHIDDQLRSFYRDDEQMYRHFSELHSYVHIDFTERDLFETTLFPGVGRVETFVTQMEGMAFARLLSDEGGVFFSVEPDEPVVDLIQAVQRTM